MREVSWTFTIDPTMLKALASGTRRDILHALKERNGVILTDLARALGKHITTVKEHLQILEDAGLVDRDKRPGRKFVFYSLSKEGSRIMLPYVSDVSVVFLVGFIVMMGGLEGLRTGPGGAALLAPPPTVEAPALREAGTPSGGAGAPPPEEPKAEAGPLAGSGPAGAPEAPRPDLGAARSLADEGRAFGAAEERAKAAPPAAEREEADRAGAAAPTGAPSVAGGGARDEAGAQAPPAPQADRAGAPAPSGRGLSPSDVLLAVGFVAMAHSLAVARRRQRAAAELRALPYEG